MAHMSNYQKILAADEYILAKPNAVEGIDGYDNNNRLINVVNSIELALIVVIIIDMIVKLTNHICVLKSNFTDSKSSEDQIYFDEPLTFDPFKNNGGQFLIKTEYVVMDAILVVVIVVMYII